MDDRQKFDAYVEKLNAIMRSDEFYQTFRRRLRASKPQLKLAKKSRTKQFETDWIEMIESCITNLDNIVRNPRKFIVIEEDIVDISLARAISTESVKHLAQHTNMIASVDKEGNVTPNKILNTTKEESFEIYENRFIYTLLKNLYNFITRRMDAIKKAYVNDNILELDVDANFYMGKTRVFYNLELIGSLPSDVEQEIQGSDLKIVERVTKLQRIISDFLSSPFAKQMVNSAPVRPPITRTNVILKNPDFKKALVLWQFIESYSKMGFSVENVSEKMAVDEDVETAVSDMMFMCNSLMEGLVQNKVEDSLFFSESNMTEQEIEEQEKEVEKEKEEEKTEETPTPESVEVPSPEEQEGETGEEGEEQETQAEEEKQQEQEEEEELPDEFGVAELRNLFQQTEGKVDKAQLARINKAIDRVLLNESTLRAKKKSEIAEIRFRQQEIEQEKLLKEMEKEKLALERSLAKKEKIAAKERESLEKQKERDRKRLQKLEEEMREKQEALQSQEIAADVEQREDLGEVEDLSVKPMLAALKEDGAENNAAIETPAQDEVAADANEEQGATAAVGSEGVAEQDGENNFPEENAAAAEKEDLNSDGNDLAESGEKLSSEAVDETENNDGRQEE